MPLCSMCGSVFTEHEYECKTYCRKCRPQACDKFSVGQCEPRRSGQGIIPSTTT